MRYPRNIIIDTDPGVDDAVAVLFACARTEELNILGLTTVAGNVSIKRALKNARAVCEMAGRRDIRVYEGCAKPISRSPVKDYSVDTAIKLGHLSLPNLVAPAQGDHAVDYIVATLRSEPRRSVSLCALGPLTNIATAFLRAPDVVANVEQIVLMGGAHFEFGNVTPNAEFNILADPEAADIVVNSGVDIVFVPLDVTHRVLITPERNQRLRSLGNVAGTACAKLLEDYATCSAPLHDPCVIGYLLAPELFQGKSVNVQIETISDLTTGMTVTDWRKVSNRKENALFLTEVDSDGFFDLLFHSLARADF